MRWRLEDKHARTAAKLLILAEMLYAAEHPLPMEEDEGEDDDD